MIIPMAMAKLRQISHYLHIIPGESLKERHFVDADINKNGKYILYVNAESANGSELSVQTAVNAI